jgi:poly(hydroxyalkanoate) depolymerase family esterase
MRMNNHTQNGMAEATRLTQQGRLEEATAAIQRALGGTYVPVSSPGGSGGADGPIDVDSWVVKETHHGPVAGRRAADRGPDAARRTSLPPNLFTRGVQHTSGMTARNLTSVNVPKGARFVERTYTNGAGTRSYKIYVPSGYVGQAIPLIVMLHGCTQNPDDFATGTHMNDLAEEHTFLVAYPAQAGNANMQKCWNWFQAADQQRGRGEPSIIAGITSQVAEEYEVAEGRVYIAGMSAGGAMAAIIGATYPDLYAAVGVHSGLAPGAASDLSSAFTAMRQGGPVIAHENVSGRDREILPTIIFHGDGDTTVHPRNGDRLLAHLSSGRSVTSLRVRTRRGRVQGGHEYTRFTYHDTEGRDLVERWSVHGLGHAWSGGSYPGSYTDPKGPDASAEMVRFFEQHHKR